MTRAGCILVLSWLLGGVAAAEPAGAGLRARVEKAVRATLPEGLGIAELSLPGTARLPADATVALSWPYAPAPGLSSVQVVLSRKGREIGRTWARLRLATLRRVVVAARPLEVGQPVVAGDLEVAERPVARPDGLEVSPEVLLGRQVAQPVAAGAVVHATDVVMPAPLPRGTEVQVVFEHPAFRITAPGSLERATRVGEDTVARIAGGSSVVKGRLTSARRLTVQGSEL